MINNGNCISARDLIGNTISVAPQLQVQPLDVRRTWSVNVPGRPSTFSFVGAVSFCLTGIGTAASLYSMLFGTLPNAALSWLASAAGPLGAWAIAPMVLGLLLFLTGIQLMRARFLTLGPVALEVDDDNLISISRFTAPCPRCNARLHMTGGSEHDPGVFFICSRNRDHAWRFDYTTL